MKEHLEFNGKHLVDISVGDAILYPGAIIESLGAIDVAGLKDAPVKGAWSRKYLAKVSYGLFRQDLTVRFSTTRRKRSRTHSASLSRDHQS